VTPGAFVNVINQTMSAGVPTMTVNTDSPPSHRMAFYSSPDTATPGTASQMGKIAGQFTVKWAQTNHVDLNGQQVALITGDTTAPWAQGRMRGWLDVVQAAFPKMVVVGSPTNALTTGYIPATIYSKMSAFMTGHPQVKFYFDSDWGSAEIGELIDRNHLKGKVFTVGYNIDSTYVQYLKKGTILGTVDQRYDLQAQNFVLGCAKLLLNGTKPPAENYVAVTVWTPTNIEQALALYRKIPNSGVA
jgi:ABC-type sugar transport system substrate-binding protein